VSPKPDGSPIHWWHPAAKELDELQRKAQREISLLRRRFRIREHAALNQKMGGTRLERLLWSLAKWSPFSGMAVPTDLSNPYMLRTYLTPDGMRLHLPRALKGKSDYGVSLGARPYLHHFFRGDDAAAYHNHPWRISYSLILTGGYVEFKLNPETKEVTRRVFKPGSFNVLRREDYHRVELLDEAAGCWTLFISVDRLAESDGTDWDFMDPETGVKIPWGEYNQPGRM